MVRDALHQINKVWKRYGSEYTFDNQLESAIISRPFLPDNYANITSLPALPQIPFC